MANVEEDDAFNGALRDFVESLNRLAERPELLPSGSPERNDMPSCEVAPGVRLYYEDFGEGDPIVFISGGHLTHRIWESQVAALAGRFRTITFDWRGTGASDKPRTGYSAATAAGDVCSLIQRLELAPALLVGHGLGAHLALLAAAKHPERVRALLLAAAAPWLSGERNGVRGGLPEEFLRFVVSKAAGGNVPYAQTCFELAEHWIFHRQQSPGVYQWLLQQALEWPQHVANSYANSMRQLDHSSRLPQIDCPALIVQGRHDRKIAFSGAVHVAQTMPNARLVVFENSAHMTNIEEVDSFNETLGTFAGALASARQAA
jgi:pimeloyl-ACP methyl ester carboxylesterase